jgi:seryl-tRNA synthetase
MKETHVKKKQRNGERSKKELDDLQMAAERGESLFPRTEEVNYDKESTDAFVKQTMQEDSNVRKSKIRKTLRNHAERMSRLEAELVKKSMEINNLQQELTNLHQELESTKRPPTEPVLVSGVSQIEIPATVLSGIDEKIAKLACKHGIT